MTTKRTTKKTTKSAEMNEAAITARVIDFLVELPEISESGFSRGDLELAIEDRGWLNPATTSFTSRMELEAVTRLDLIRRSRQYWSRDPLAKQAVRLWTDYSVGTGFSFVCDDEAVMKEIRTFWNDRRNRRTTGAQGQRKFSNRLLIDGDVFFVIFTTDTGKVIRSLNAAQVTNMITDPDDDENILAYARQMPDGTFKYYADWAQDEDGHALAEQQTGVNGKGTVQLEEDAVVYHVSLDPLGKFGNGILFAAVDWAREHRRFMEARVAIVQALSKYAHKLTIKGGQSVIDGMIRKLGSSVPGNGPSAIERNAKPVAGSTFAGNAGAELEAMPRDTGGAEARDDSNNLKLMVSAATGIMLHYFGDGSDANLATATAMELPMLKMFSAYQHLWGDAWRDIIAIVRDEDPADELAAIEAEAPSILQADIAKIATAIGSLVPVMPEIKQPEVLSMVLVALGVANVEHVMTVVRKELESNKALADAGRQALAGAAADSGTGDNATATPADAGSGKSAAAPGKKKTATAIAAESAIGELDGATMAELTKALNRFSEAMGG